MKQQRITAARRKELRRKLIGLAGPHLKLVYKQTALSWVQFATRVASFAIIAWALACVFANQEIPIVFVCVSLLLLAFIGYSVARLARKDAGVVSQQARDQLKAQFFSAFQSRRGQFEAEVPIAEVLTVAAQGIDSLDTFYSVYIPILYRSFAQCASVLVIIGLLFPIGGVAFLLCLPLIPVSIVLVQKRSQQIMQHYWATYLDVGNTFLDHVTGLNTLYAYGVDEQYAASFADKAEQFRQSTMTLLRFQLQSVGYMDGVMYVGIAVAGFLGIQAMAAQQLNVFAFIWFVLLSTEFFMPLRELGYSMHLLMMHTKMADRIFSFLDAVQQEPERAGTVASAAVQQVVLDRVGYAYGNHSVLSEVSATIRAGSLWAVAGVSGSGKTTLTRIIAQQVSDYSGQVVSDQPLDGQVVVVSPDSYVFEGTILDNVRLGNQQDAATIAAWAEREGLLSFVNELADGWETQVGANGRLLSPGQRQQIVCARALLRRASVYLFDEVTSSVDRDNEAVLFAMAQRLSRHAIVLYVTHKMRYVQQADNVLFLIAGQSAVVGTPHQLYEQVADYRELVDTQAELEKILDEQ